MMILPIWVVIICILFSIYLFSSILSNLPSVLYNAWFELVHFTLDLLIIVLFIYFILFL